MKKIKAKQTIKDIKVLDKAVDLSHRAKTTYIRSKKQSEQIGHNEEGNFVDDAGNRLQEGAESVVRKMGSTAVNYGKKAGQEINKNRRTDKDAPLSDASSGSRTRPASESETGRPKMEQKSTLSESKEGINRRGVYPEKTKATESDVFLFKAKEGTWHNSSPPGVNQVIQQNAAQSRAKEPAKRKYVLARPKELAKHRFVQARARQRSARTGEIRAANREASHIQMRQASRYITTETAQRSLFQPAEKTAAQIMHTSGKSRYNIKQSGGAGGNTIKEAYKGTIKTARKSVKTAGHTAKAAVKTSQMAKDAAKTVQVAQGATQSAQAAAERTAAVSAKTATKAMAAAIKAISTAVKGMSSLIAAGGGSAIVIILVICLAGLLIGSGYGIFFSNESSGKNTPIMTEVVSQLNEEFKAEIERIENENPHDTLDLSINGGSITMVSNWRDILVVYAVKVAADPKNGLEVATLDDTKVGILRDIFWDMNKIDYWIERIEHTEIVTTTDKDGNEIEETNTTTEAILHIKVTSKSSSDMIAKYGFNAEQVKMLNELIQDEYKQLFMQLIDRNEDITMFPLGDSDTHIHRFAEKPKILLVYVESVDA